MGGMFYSLKEVMAKMKKTEADVEALVKQGRLREFRDGPNLLFKIEEVESLLSDTTFMAAQKPSETKPDEEEVELVLEGDEQKTKPDADITAVASEGINVLGETETEFNMPEDTLAETKAAAGATSIIDGALGGSQAAADEASLEEIEENVNLDTFGSGSGLLDLSLQADDTSLGGILDEIYTPESEEGKEKAKEGSGVELAAEADQLAEKQELPAAAEAVSAEAVAIEAAPEAIAYIEPATDKASNMLGIMLFVPLLAVIYAIVVAMAGQKEIASSVLALKGLTWLIIGCAAVLTGVLSAAAFMPARAKTPKAPKVKKEKKSKKDKKGEEPVAEAATTDAALEETAKAEVTEESLKLETGTGTAESADLMSLEEPASAEDIKLDDIDLSDVKDIKEDEDKI